MNGKTRVKAFSTALLAKLAKQQIDGKSIRYRSVHRSQQPQKGRAFHAGTLSDIPCFMRRVSKTRYFQRWMRKTDITDSAPCGAGIGNGTRAHRRRRERWRPTGDWS